jgi:hypothetical protein
VQPVLDRLPLRHSLEQQPGRRHTRRRQDLDLAVVVHGEGPSQELGPPSPEGLGIVGVDEDLFEAHTHASSVA